MLNSLRMDTTVAANRQYVFALLLVCALIFAGCSQSSGVCGDGRCEGGEDALGCPADCLVAGCGDGQCGGAEDQHTCPVDCYCGNGTCDADESTLVCAADCQASQCGNLVCEPGESNNDCPGDCPSPECGNGVCEAGESNPNCPGDCPDAVCGNGACETGEDTWSCLQDCGATCGNGVLENGEICDGSELGGASCLSAVAHTEGVLFCNGSCQLDPADCSTCGDGAVDGSEQCDGSNLAGSDCASLGLSAGTLACDGGCQWNTSGCSVCGDGVCEAGYGETFAVCAADCGFLDAVSERGTTCALRGDGTVWCWGLNFDGWLGDGSTASNPVPQPVTGITNAVAVDGGSDHSCAPHHDGTVSCWGSGGFGQLGQGTSDDALTPVQVLGLTDVVDVSAGGYNSCAIRSDGSTWCWGRGSITFLGPGTVATESCVPYGGTTYSCSTTPVQVSSPHDAVAIDSESNATCTVHADGSVRCWGYLWDQSDLDPGYFSPLISTAPSPLSAPLLMAGATYCAVDSGDQLLCWGSNITGQLGIGTTGDGTNVLSPVQNLPQVVAAAGGGNVFGSTFVCAVDLTGQVYCWGENGDGQLGDGTATSTNLPAPVAGVTNAVAVAAGDEHACAVLNTGAIVCWGSCAFGRLGNGQMGCAADQLPQQILMP